VPVGPVGRAAGVGDRRIGHDEHRRPSVLGDVTLELPISSERTPVTPRVPITMRAAPSPAAASTIARQGGAMAYSTRASAASPSARACWAPLRARRSARSSAWASPAGIGMASMSSQT